MTSFPFSPRIDFGNNQPAWGPHRPADFTSGTWIAVGSIAVGASAFTCADGVVLDGITDTDAVNASYYVHFFPTSPIQTEGRKYFSFRVRFVSSEPFLVGLGENVNHYNLAQIIIDPLDPLNPQVVEGQVIAVTTLVDSTEYLLRTNDAMLPGVTPYVLIQPARNNPTHTGIGQLWGNIVIYEDLQQVIPLSNSMGMWLPDRVVRGGQSESAAGIPETFVVRKDSILKLTLRLNEDEWWIIPLWLDWCFDKGSLGSFKFYPHRDALTRYYDAWLVSPKMNDRWNPTRLPQQNMYEMSVELRLKQQGRIFDLRLLQSQLV